MSKTLQVISVIFLLTISFQLLAQNDTSIYSFHNVTIQGKKYCGFLTSRGFHLLNSKNDSYLEHIGDYFSWKFEDFNGDGYKDIFLDKGGNVPELFDLLIYVPSIESFRQVINFDKFPAPVKIRGTRYFYSYHKSGCADMDWGSDLFYIHNYEATRIGNISGYECENSGIKDGLYIYKFHDKNKMLIKTLPIDKIHKIKDDKWGFIKEYWTKHCKLFV